MDQSMSKFLYSISQLQNSASWALLDKNLGKAHVCLKNCAISIFEKTGATGPLSFDFAVPLFLTLFRCGYYLEDAEGNYLYRYEAIPGQFGNACHFQLGLSALDGSGYQPSWEAKKECARAAHKLLGEHSLSIIIQSRQERRKMSGRQFLRWELHFSVDRDGYPKVTPRQGMKGKPIDFRKPRFFSWSKFQSRTLSLDESEGDWLEHIEQSMLLNVDPKN